MQITTYTSGVYDPVYIAQCYIGGELIRGKSKVSPKAAKKNLKKKLSKHFGVIARIGT